MKFWKKGAVVVTLVTLLAGSYLYQISGTSIQAQEDENDYDSGIVGYGEADFDTPLASMAAFADASYPRDENGDIPADYAESAEADTSIYSASQIKDISSDADFTAALRDSTIVVFNIVADFAVTESTGTENIVYSNASGNPGGTRKIIIEGNDHTVDFRGRAYRPNTGGPFDITIQNLSLYSRHYYGFISTTSLSSAYQNQSRIVYHDVTTLGSQLLRADNTPVEFSGTVSTTLVESYTSPFGGSFTTQSFSNQQNLEVNNAVVHAGTKLTLVAGNVGSTDIKSGGTLELHPNAKVYIDNTATVNNATGELAETLLISGNLDMEEQSELSVVTGPARSRSAIRISGNGSSLLVGRKAKLDVKATNNTAGDGTNYNVIRLGSNATLAVEEEGIFNVSSTQTGTGTGSVIYADNTATFTVAKKGSFSVEADGTGSKSLIRMGTGAKFIFSDAQSVDMKFIGTPNNASSLIDMSGSAGRFDVDVQRVQQWNRGNESDTPDKDWSPMFGMKLPYSSRVINNSNIIARSTTASIRSDFINYFNTGVTKTVSGTSVPGAQRVRFEYIPDVTVSIDSISNDLAADVGSNTVYGVTNPDAYVRITYTPPNGGQPITIDHTVSSPVEANEGEELDEQTSPFTVQAAGSQGTDAASYSYTLPNGQHFEAGGVIEVYSFKEGKSSTVTQVVLDATPPTADAQTVHSAVGETNIDPEWFVTNPQDTNPNNAGFTYEFTEKTDQATVLNMLQTQGEYDVYVNVVDAAGNKTEVLSKLVVHETLNGITADNVEASATILSGMTEAQLKAYILQESGADAFKIVDGVQTSLTDKIQVTDLGGLTPSSTGGQYSVTLTVAAADSGIGYDLEKVIQVTFLDEVAPTGTGQLTIVPLGDAGFIRDEANLSKFLKEYSDDLTATDQIQIRFADNIDFDALVATEGDNAFYLILTDEAGNDSEPIKVPIYVFDGAGGQVSINGSDFTVDYADWSANSTTTATLRDYVLAQSKAKAIEVQEDVIADVTTDATKVTVDTSQVGSEEVTVSYPVVLTVTSNGQTATKTVQVTFTDKTKPTGTGKLTLIDVGDTAAITNAGDYTAFLTDWADNVSSKKHITVTLKEGQDVTNIVSSVGPSSFMVVLTDEAGNSAEVAVPIYVKDAGSIVGDKYIIQAADFSVAAIDYPTTAEGILDMIREKGQLKLFERSDSTITELDAKEIAITTGTLPAPPEAGQVPADGVYEVTLAYGEDTSKAQGSIDVTIVKSLDTLTVEFVDESGNALRDAVTVDGTIGSLVDLTKEKTVTDAIAAILADRYQVNSRPESETAIEIINGGKTVQYTFAGTLSIYSAPSVIDFRTQDAGIFGVRVEDPDYDDNLVIWDNRSGLGSWTLKARLETYLTSGSGTGAKILPDALRYRVGEGKDSEIILNNEDLPIVVDSHTGVGQYDVSEKWATGERGFKLDVPAGAVRELGDYTATIVWTVGETK